MTEMNIDPTVVDASENDTEFADRSLRVIALQHAGLVTSRETPVDIFIDNAAKLEDYLRNGQNKSDKPVDEA